MKTILRHHWLPLILTGLVWGLIGYYMGLAAFVLVVILTLLEMTLSADNAVINSRVLVTMSPLWQKLFLTVGIFIAVFVMRFAMPILIVAATTALSSFEVLHLALGDADAYGLALKEAAPLIDGFGGMFLLMVGLYFFTEKNRQHLWIAPVEKALSRLGELRVGNILVVAAFVALIYGLIRSNEVLLAMLLAVLIYLVLHGVTFLMERFADPTAVKHKVGWAAFAAFVYLEVLDASFSLDGVIGAFALTNNIIIIMAGLGIGAVWVRTMTVHLVETKTLARYKYLESGAHWAIIVLGSVMILKLFHIELPEIFIGTIGLFFIGLSVMASIREQRKTE